MSKNVERRQLEWRRAKVLELSSQGHSQAEIAGLLQISAGTVNRDLSILRLQARNNIKKYIDERLPQEYDKCLIGLNLIHKRAWNIAETSEDNREKIQALSLAKEVYSLKLELLTNAGVVDDAIRFVSEKTSALALKAKSKSNEEQDENESITNKVF